MLSKTYFMKSFIEPFEEKFGKISTELPQMRNDYIRRYYALLKYNPNAHIHIMMMLDSEVIMTPSDIADIICDDHVRKNDSI